MPIIHNKEKLEKLLNDNNIPLTDSRAKGKFFKEHFNWEELSKLYIEGQSLRYICRLTGLSYDVVRANLKDKVIFRDFSVLGNSKFKINLDIFNTSNPVSSYILGWLYSDGCNTLNKINLELQTKDHKHLEYLAKLLGNKPVKYKTKSVAIDLYSVELCKLLDTKWHVKPRKSFTNFRIPFELFSDKDIPYLLLGLLEGDGSISSSTSNVCFLISRASLKGFMNSLLRSVTLEHQPTIRDLNSQGLISISFRGADYFSILTYIYLNTLDVRCLSRKFENFKSQITRSSKGLTSPYKKLAVKLWDSLSNIQRICSE